MTNNVHLAATDALSTLGSIIDETAARDAIHIAVEPVIAGVYLMPGQDIGIRDGKATPRRPFLGIVDPFLGKSVNAGERFWMLVYPRTITSLRHVWTHPGFTETESAAAPVQAVSSKDYSTEWMQKWAMEHMSIDYYGDLEKLSHETAFAQAIDAGHGNHIGPYEEARDYIDDQWWDHWEAITGAKGNRGTYFSCSC